LGTDDGSNVRDGDGGIDVNGPEDMGLDWDAIDWCLHEGHVRRLRQGIFKRRRTGTEERIHSLQKLMLRSWSNTVDPHEPELLDGGIGIHHTTSEWKACKAAGGHFDGG
jgi:hypothetical protein